jgi:hypothetical protein
MIASFATSVLLSRFGYSLGDPASPSYAKTMLITVGVTTAVWLGVTFATPPESRETLDRFYTKVRPGGAGWRTVAARLGFERDTIPGGALSWVNWIAGLVAVYTAVFGLGALLTGSPGRGVLYLALSTAAFLLIQRNLRADERLVASVDIELPSRLQFEPRK